MENVFSSFLAQDFEIALQSATKNFKFKIDFSEYRFERVKRPQKHFTYQPPRHISAVRLL